MAQIPQASKARTIAHMNKDHQTDLSHILQHFCMVPPSMAENPEMVDIDLTSITIKCESMMYFVPINPPMASWDDRRQRLIDMTLAARSALGITPAEEEDRGNDNHGDSVVVKDFVPPRPQDWAVFVSVAFYFVCFAVVRSGMAESGTPLGNVLNHWLHVCGISDGAAWYRWLVNTIFIPVMCIHISEVFWLDRTRLGRFGVRRGSWAWWRWMSSGFFEGVMVFKRFDAVVEGLKKKQ
ncbi:hypothetical protein QBC46DRAFT_381784 [Diplogelasinospora grovesii]|uniref:DUF2470 domain-containing protein n=1 Tax=Diplogelasinospora grovesii TaxID=303347 RepID=A0AAN6S6D4_9PEZI|nr:hypothetical protein QBC46DRAFT_381784 [Diplogelasinospora grovesii]